MHAPGDALRYFLPGAAFNAIRILFLGTVIGFYARDSTGRR
jgi:hypothetical protein